MKKGCLIGTVGLLALCLVGCGLGFFVGLPRIRENAREELRDAISTEVANQIPAGSSGVAEPGSYTFTAAELQRSLAESFQTSTIDDIVIRIDASGIAFGFKTSGGRETTYSGLPIAENGRLKMTKMDATDSILDFVIPATDLGKAIEDAVNNYLAANNLKIDTLTLTEGEITFDTVQI